MKGLFRTMGVVILSLIVTTAFGQQRGQGGMRNMDPEEGAKRSIEQMKEIIKLNNSKEEKAVKEIFIKYAKERQKLFSSMQQGGDRTQMRTKMGEVLKKQNVELKKMLGEERFDTYNKKMEEQRAERRRR